MTSTISEDALKGQQSRIMNAMRKATQPEMGSDLRDIAGALTTQNTGGQSYFNTMKQIGEQQAQTNINAEMGIYNQMKEQAGRGDAEAKAVDDAINEVAGNDPKIYASILQDLHSDPENINASNAKSKVMKYAAERGITPLSVQADRANVTKLHVDNTKKSRENSGEDLGATGNIINKIAAEKGIPFSQAAYLYQTGYRGGTQYDASGNIAPMAGAAAARGNIKEGEAAGAKRGTEFGEVEAQLADMEASMPELEATVNDLSELGKKATYTKAGRFIDSLGRELDMEPRESALAREKYINTVQNQVFPLLRQTFGSAFTAAEGEKLLTTLGDPNKSPGEKDSALDAFIVQKKRSMQSARRRVGKSDDALREGGNIGANTNQPKKKLVYNPTTGDFD